MLSIPRGSNRSSNFVVRSARVRAFIIAITVLLGFILTAVAAASDSPAPVRCGLVTIQQASLGKEFIGSVEPARRSVVGTAVEGRVEAVLVETGDAIDEESILVQLRFRAIEMTLAAAEANAEAQHQTLAELTNGPREEELRRLDALVKAAAASKAYTEKNLARLRPLSERGAAAKGVLDEALSLKVVAEHRFLAAEAEHQAAIAGTRPEQLARAKAMVAKGQEEANQIRDALNEHTIRAPFRGFVVKRLVEKGQWVAIGDSIAEVIELDPAEVRVAIPEEHIAHIRRGQNVRIDVRSSFTSQKQKGVVLGKVFRIVPDADVRTRTFPVRIRIPNPNHGEQPNMKPGMMARVYLPVGPPSKQLAVPQDALVLDRDRTYLFAAEGRSDKTTVRRISVEAGAVEANVVHVRPLGGDQLKAGTRVVIEGNERLESGQSVVVLK